MRYGILTNEQVDRMPDDGKWLILHKRDDDEPNRWVHYDDALTMFHISRVRQRFGNWVVTHRGVESLITKYIVQQFLVETPIDKLREAVAWRFGYWEKDFDDAVAFARTEQTPAAQQGKPSKAPRRNSLALRFRVFKRDAYRCQICGRTAQDGARLEVDHKHPRSKGGRDEERNLWTLCFDCNRGKRDRDL